LEGGKDMDKENKTKTIAVRVTEEEYAEIKDKARTNGYDSMSSFMLFLWRKIKNSL
jgi:hypothetical protein